VQATFPLVTGHEVIGHVHAVGKNVKTVKVGDRVGVGPLSGACGSCEWCAKDYEQLCPKRVFTYNGKDAHGRITYGGYADGIVVQDKFAIKVPAGLDSANAAPLLCAGVTVFSPLLRYTGSTPGQKVAIIAIGGLGHLAVMFAAKFGHHVTAISRGTDKKDLCHQLGAEAYVDSNEQGGDGRRSTTRLTLCSTARRLTAI
jgi:D-arabinose 1-dehydrogenase-like Zn-dependent alcohol dehydrogenase